MSKSAEAFRTISEVAEWLDTPTHVLRFWESKFPQVKPVKRAGGRRYYRPADMELLSGIKKLLHDDGVTIRGVQKILREQGVRQVCALSDREIEGYERPDTPDPVTLAKPAPRKTAAPAPGTSDDTKVVALRPKTDPAPLQAVPPVAVPEPVAETLPVSETDDPVEDSQNIFAEAEVEMPSLFDRMADPTPVPPVVAAPNPLPPVSPTRVSAAPVVLDALRTRDPALLAPDAAALVDPAQRLRALRSRIAQSLSQKPV